MDIKNMIMKKQIRKADTFRSFESSVPRVHVQGLFARYHQAQVGDDLAGVVSGHRGGPSW